MMSDCPSIAAIEAYVAGGCRDLVMLHHFDQCAACAARRCEIEADNAFLGEISRTMALRSAVSSRSGMAKSLAASSDQQIMDLHAFDSSTPPSRSASSMESIPGYEIHRVIGRGGQAVVYEALQLSTKRRVALKVMLYGSSRTLGEPGAPGIGGSSSLPRTGRFEREVRLVAQLRHPGIVTVFDSGTTTDGRPYFAMEYIDGTSIHEWAQSKDQKPASIQTTLQLIVSLCEAVRYAHQRGVIHRDLKPNNILVDGEGNPRLLDFGLAKMDDGHLSLQLTVSGQFLGTLAYAAPEQLRGEPHLADTRTDVYALGVILYELLTGRPMLPLEGSFSQIVRMIAEREPERPSVARPEIDDELETVVRMAIAKDPERRYENAGAFLDDLQRYMDGRPIAAKRDSGWYILRKIVRRYRVPALVAIAFLVLTLCYGITMSVLYRLATNRENEARLAAARLVNERDSSQIERGRTLVTTGRAALAHDLIWSSFHLRRTTQGMDAASAASQDHAIPSHQSEDPIERQAYWALRELYQHHPFIRRIPFVDHGLGSYGLIVNRQGDLFLMVASNMWKQGKLLAWSPDDLFRSPKEMIVGSSETMITFFHCESSGDRQFIVAAAGSQLGVMDAWTGKIIADRTFASSHAAVAIDPKGKWFARVASDDTRTIEIWDVETESLKRTLNTTFGPDAGGLGRMFVSPDGELLIVASAIPRDMSPQILLYCMSRPDTDPAMILDVPHHAHSEAAGQPRTTLEISLSGDGKRLAAVFEYRAQVWDIVRSQPAHASQLALSNHEIPKLRKLTQWATSSARQSPWPSLCEMSYTGARLATFGNNHQVQIWDADEGRLLASLAGHSRIPRRAAFTEDDRTLYTADEKAVVAWDLSGLDRPKWQWEWQRGSFSVHDAEFFPGNSDILAFCGGIDRAYRVSVDGAVRLLDLSTGAVIADLPAGDLVASSLSISADGAMLAVCSYDGTVRLWDVREPSNIVELHRMTGPQQLNSVAIDPLGANVAAACDDGAVYIWDAADGQLRAVLHHADPAVERLMKRLPSLAFSPDGQRIASASADGTVKIWNVKERSATVLRGHTSSVRKLAFSPEGKLLATGGDDLSIRLWDIPDGELRRVLQVATERVYALCFSPDGLLLAAAGTDGQIIFWDPHEGRQLLLLDDHNIQVMSLQFSPDGNKFAASLSNAGVKVWDLRRFDAHMESNRIFE